MTRQWVDGRWVVDHGPISCVSCGMALMRPESGRPPKYCAECRPASYRRSAAWAKAHGDHIRGYQRERSGYRPLERIVCDQCGSAASSYVGDGLCARCRVLATRRVPDPVCAACGVSFARSGTRDRFCSDACRPKGDTPEVTKRRNHRRRSRRAGIVLVVSVVADECGVCQRPLTDARWPDPMSTTVGHEPPLARAAADGWQVVAERPEHFACNLRKATRYDGEAVA